MVIYCSRDIFEALDGVHFPATKDDVLDYAELNDAPEAVLVTLNRLPDDVILHDVSDVCENARIACNYDIINNMRNAAFPSTRKDLLSLARNTGAPESVINALKSLPSGYTFHSLDDICEYVL
ncbi:MAG: DUF2795 domain-containing protein [Armatimonadota bacterium]